MKSKQRRIYSRGYKLFPFIGCQYSIGIFSSLLFIHQTLLVRVNPFDLACLLSTIFPLKIPIFACWVTLSLSLSSQWRSNHHKFIRLSISLFTLRGIFVLERKLTVDSIPIWPEHCCCLSRGFVVAHSNDERSFEDRCASLYEVPL